MTKIALVSHSIHMAGAERMLYNLAKGLHESSLFDPVIYVPGTLEGDMGIACEQDGIAVRQIPAFPWYIYAESGNKHLNAAETLGAIDDLTKQISDDGIEMIIANTAVSMVPVMAGVRSGIPVIGWVHGILDNFLIPVEFDPARRLFMDRLFMALSDTVVFNSCWTARFYEQYAVSPTVMMHNWTPHPEKVTPVKPDNNIFVCLNTFDHYKGIYTLIDASAILYKTHKNFRVYFYGDGGVQVKEDMKEKIGRLKLDDHVFMRGRTINIADVYNDSLCLVQPSFIESFGMTLIEAMAYGRPVIAAKSGGPQEIVLDGETGFLTERNNPEELAEKMAYILDNREKARQFGKKGMDVFKEKFSPEAGISNFVNKIQTVMEQYEHIDVKRDLYYECALRFLQAEALSSQPTDADDAPPRNTGKSGPVLPHPNVCQSLNLKMVKRRVAFNVYCNEPQISALGLIFTCFGKSAGAVDVALSYRGRELRRVSFDIANIVNNQWAYFPFDTVYGTGGKELTVEISAYYTAGSEPLGVYENNLNRTFWYKVANKLGGHIKGRDVLLVNFVK